MVKFYTIQIRMGKITIEDVLEKYRAEVQEALDEGKYMPGDVD